MAQSPALTFFDEQASDPPKCLASAGSGGAVLTLTEVFVGRYVGRQSQRLPLLPGGRQSRLVGTIQALQVLDRRWTRLIRSATGWIPPAIGPTSKTKQLRPDNRLLQSWVVSPVSRSQIFVSIIQSYRAFIEN